MTKAMLMHKVDKKFMLTYLLITANILVYIYTSIVGRFNLHKR